MLVNYDKPDDFLTLQLRPRTKASRSLQLSRQVKLELDGSGRITVMTIRKASKSLGRTALRKLIASPAGQGAKAKLNARKRRKRD
jgi:hypothetical protein